MLEKTESVISTYSAGNYKRVVSQLYGVAHSRTQECFVAIDGPAAGGKGTTASHFRKELEYKELGYGTFARCVTWFYLTYFSQDTSLNRFITQMKRLRIQRYNDRGIDKVVLQNNRVFGTITLDLASTDELTGLRSNRVSKQVSLISEWPAVVSFINQKLIEQAHIAKQGKTPIIVEGRDNEQIFRADPTVNWFDTMLLVYLDAELEVLIDRAMKRALVENKGNPLTKDQIEFVRSRLIERNRDDMAREKGFGRLVTAEEAQRIPEYTYFDTSELDELQVFYALCFWQLQKIGIQPGIELIEQADVPPAQYSM